MEPKPDLTLLLARIRTGDTAASHELISIVYEQLRRIAKAQLRRQPGTTTMFNPTLLVHEAYLKLFGENPVGFNNSSHFLGVAATAMRHFLIDRAREKERVKNGALLNRVLLDDDLLGKAIPTDTNVLDLDTALARLARTAPRAAQVIEIVYFTGSTVEQAAEHLGISPATARRDWVTARAWLRRELGARDPEGTDDG